MWGMGDGGAVLGDRPAAMDDPVRPFAGSLHLFGDAGPQVPATALAAWMVVLGTVFPFSIVVISMQHLRASQASVVGMTEPIFATAIAWLVLGEALKPIQIVGAAIVLGASSWRSATAMVSTLMGRALDSSRAGVGRARSRSRGPDGAQTLCGEHYSGLGP